MIELSTDIVILIETGLPVIIMQYHSLKLFMVLPSGWVRDQPRGGSSSLDSS